MLMMMILVVEKHGEAHVVEHSGESFGLTHTGDVQQARAIPHALGDMYVPYHVKLAGGRVLPICEACRDALALRDADLKT